MKHYTPRPSSSNDYNTLIDGYHALVRAIIARAYWDSLGKIGTSTKLSNEGMVELMQDARDFFKDGRCRHWVEMIGCDPEGLKELGLE